MSESEAERAGVGAGAGGPASGQLQAIFLRANLMRCYCCQPALRLAGWLFYLVLLLLLITMAIIIVAHGVSIPMQDYLSASSAEELRYARYEIGTLYIPLPVLPQNAVWPTIGISMYYVFCLGLNHAFLSAAAEARGYQHA